MVLLPSLGSSPVSFCLKLGCLKSRKKSNEWLQQILVLVVHITF